MKKIVLLITCSFIISLISSAQISKGSILLGGGLNYSNNDFDNNTNKSRTYGFSPSIGIAVRENKVLGLSLFFSHLTNHVSGSPSDAVTNNYGAGIFLRKYLPVGKNFYLFGQGNADFNYYKYELKDLLLGRLNEHYALGIRLFPGLSYALTKKFHLELGLYDFLQLNYSVDKSQTTSPGGTTTSKKSTGFSFISNANPVSNVSLGFRFIIGK
jgi:hypothetical protein